MGLRVAHITTSHVRTDQRIFRKECRSLVKAGIDTFLIVFDGLGDDFVDGVRIRDLGKFGQGRIGRFIHRPMRALGYALRNHYDIYHLHDPELLPVAGVLNVLRRSVIFDLHEDYGHQIATRTGIPRWIRAVLGTIWPLFERLILRRLRALIVPQRDMQLRLQEINAATFLVPNFVDTTPSQHSLAGKHLKAPRLIYVGALSVARGIENLANVMRHSEPDWSLVLAGKIDPPDLLQLLERHPNRHQIEYRGVVTPEEVANLLESATIGLILYNNVGQYGTYAWATKIFEYMRFGLPVVMPNFGAWLEFNAEHQCGLCVDPTNPLEVANAIKQLRMDPQRAQELSNNGLRIAAKQYHWGISEEALLAAYRTID